MLKFKLARSDFAEWIRLKEVHGTVLQAICVLLLLLKIGLNVHQVGILQITNGCVCLVQKVITVLCATIWLT